MLIGPLPAQAVHLHVSRTLLFAGPIFPVAPNGTWPRSPAARFSPAQSASIPPVAAPPHTPCGEPACPVPAPAVAATASWALRPAATAEAPKNGAFPAEGDKESAPSTSPRSPAASAPPDNMDLCVSSGYLPHAPIVYLPYLVRNWPIFTSANPLPSIVHERDTLKRIARRR